MTTPDRRPASEAPDATQIRPVRSAPPTPRPAPVGGRPTQAEGVPSPALPTDPDPNHTAQVAYEFADSRGERLAGHHFATPQPALGRIGEYEVLHEIARGGMGVVYRARHLTLNRVVALKTMLEPEGASEQGVKRFHIEAAAAARLQHPNIVQIYEVGRHEGTHFYAMEYVEGRTLLDMIEKEKLAPARAAAIIRKVADALAYAHEARIVHRDIKPQNILVDARDEPKLSDFGLAKDFTRATILTASGVALGTPMYMSPEQAMGRSQDLDHRSDLYSLGAVLYHALAGRTPYQGDSPLSVMNKVVVEEPVPVSRLAAEVDRDLETICLKAMQKDRENRYQTAREMALDLERYLAGQSILARRPSLAELSWRWLRQHRRASLAALVAVALFAGSIAWLALDSSRQREATALANLRQQEATALAQAAADRANRIVVAPPSGDPREPAIELAEAAQVRNQLLSALEDTDRAIAIDPRCIPAWRTKAALLQRMGLYGKAMAALDELGKLAPLTPDDRYFRGRVAHEGGDGEGCRAILEELLKSNPESTLAALARARSMLAQGDAAGVLGTLRAQAMEASDRQAEALRLVALAQVLKEESKQATESISKALAIAPGSYYDYLTLAQIHANRHDWEAMNPAFRGALALAGRPGDQVLVDWGRSCGNWSLDCKERGVTARQEKAEQAAFAMLDEAALQSPENSDVRLVQGDLRRDFGKSAEARDAFLEAERLATETAKFFPRLRLLEIYVHWPETGNAREYYAKLCQEGKLDVERLVVSNLVNLVELLIKLKLLDEASELVATGLLRQPESVSMYLLEGQLHLRRKEAAAAIKSFTRVIEIAPNDYKHYMWRAKAHSARKGTQGAAAAIADYGSAIAAAPDLRDPYFKRCLQYARLLDWPHALADIEQVIMMSPLDLLETLRRDLETGAPSPLFEKLDDAMRGMLLVQLPTFANRLSERGFAALEKGDLEAARGALERAKLVNEKSWTSYYGLAAIHARQSEWEFAAYRLSDAVDHGFDDAEKLESDPAFATLRGRNEFQRVLKSLKENKK